MDPWQERSATIDGGIVYEGARGRFVLTVGDLQAWSGWRPTSTRSAIG